jgi:hypothetical protein
MYLDSASTQRCYHIVVGYIRFTAAKLLKFGLPGTTISGKRDTDFMGDLGRSPTKKIKEETYVD